jgi:S1-C subfamily serine protease
MLVDVLIIIFTLSSVYRTWGSGFIHQALATGGFFGGLLLGRLLEPHTITLVHTPLSRVLVTIITILGLGFILLAIGEYIGGNIKYHLLGKQVNIFDNILGAFISIASVLISAWLLASVANKLPQSGLGIALNQSNIIKGLNRVLPSAPKLIADIGKLIDPNGFPDVFTGSEPIPRGDVNLPNLGDLASAVNHDRLSVVRIEGQGCGGIVEGSGFVVGTNVVATNAHVVAGITNPVVQDSNGSHYGQVIWFDPNLDFALIRTGGLAGQPLTISSANASPGTPAAVLGYPGGGGFNAVPAAVLDQFEASGQNIYDNGTTVRSVYEIKAVVIPGNSGGPMVSENGNVIGVVFAQSTTYSQVGYALTTAKIIAEVQQDGGHRSPVGTGACAA